MDLLSIKIVLLVAVLAAGVLGGAIPLRRRDAPESANLFRFGNAFAAGVFLGAGLIHMLPDATEAWQALGWHYPMAYLLATFAIILLLLVEHVLLPDRAHLHSHAPSGEPFLHIDELPSPLTAYAVLVALSAHSFVAGLALGAQPKISSALIISAAILAHKTTAGFALGVSLARGRLPRRRAWALLLVFAVATPLGILIGTVLDHTLEGPVQLLIEATFLSLAAGTFAYIATIDILRDEFQEGQDQWSQWLFVTLGAALMAVLAIWV